MTDLEFSNYIIGYVKACKIKGGAYIYIYGNTLLCSSTDNGTYYLINIEYLSDKLYSCYVNLMDKDVLLYFDLHIYNILNRALQILTNPNLNFQRIEFAQEDAYIPSKASDPAIRTIYNYADNPAKRIIQYTFYNMIPSNKGDEYYIDIAEDKYTPEINNTSIIRCTLLKKKPKCIIQIFRRVLNL